MDCADKEFCYINNNIMNCYDVCFFLILHDSPIQKHFFSVFSY